MHIFKNDGFTIYSFIVEQSDSNFNYIISCDETKECIVIDPIDVISILNLVRENDFKVKYVINTHAHPDHIRGNNPIIKVFLSSKILIHTEALDYVAPRSEAIEDGDIIEFGNQKVQVLHTPGHCPEHISLIIGKHIFVGDTIFVSGCGNVRYRGVVEDLYNTFAAKLSNVDEDLLIHCGHNYAKNNLEFALSIEPSNSKLKNKLDSIRDFDNIKTTIGEEKTYNPFMRFSDPVLVKNLKNKYPDMDEDPKSVFIKLRELRNNW